MLYEAGATMTIMDIMNSILNINNSKGSRGNEVTVDWQRLSSPLIGWKVYDIKQIMYMICIYDMLLTVIATIRSSFLMYINAFSYAEPMHKYHTHCCLKRQPSSKTYFLQLNSNNGVFFMVVLRIALIGRSQLQHCKHFLAQHHTIPHETIVSQ